MHLRVGGSCSSSYLMNNSHSPIRSLHCLNPANSCSSLYPSQPWPSYRQKNCHLHRTLQLDYCNSLYYHFLKYQMNSLQHIQNALALLSRLQNSNTSLLPWNLFTGLKFLNELSIKLNIKSSLPRTKFSVPLIRHICMTSCLFHILMVTTHAFHLMSLWSNHHHHSKQLIAPSDMLHLICGNSFLHHSAFLVQIIHPPLNDLHLNMPI